MKNKFKLIDGTFTAKDAEDILLNFISDKIKFHSIQLLTAIENNGNTIPDSERRIEELKNTRELILRLVEGAKSNNSKLKINCSIDIALQREKAKSNMRIVGKNKKTSLKVF